MIQLMQFELRKALQKCVCDSDQGFIRDVVSQARPYAFRKFSSWLHPLVQFTTILVLHTCGILFVLSFTTTNRGPIQYSAEIIKPYEYYNQRANIFFLFD